ncbi:MAG: PLP-dependent aminotransferase family protein [Agathobacter sp.]|nr:PLP-dependent aminotransferase family protein [Agathobacter sp.]
MLTYQMNQRDEKSKYYYLYTAIKEDILAGVIKQNEKLPSKRTLAEHLGISLITVENAYQMLKEEGYIESRERSGYFVTKLPTAVTQREKDKNRKLQLLEEPERNPMGNPMGNSMQNSMEGSMQNSKAQKEMSDSVPREENKSTSLFPASLYFKTVRSVMAEYDEQLLQKAPNEGCAILRNAIAQYLLRYRGIFAQPEQIIIGSGAEHLYGTVVRMFGNEKIYGIEDPSYSQIQKVYEGMGVDCELLKMGEEGITSEALEKTKADVLHVTPFHSYPSGVTATVGKRYEYLEWAKKGDCYIVEDDFDSEFFMPGKPIETLYALDHENRVIYINTFSKSLSPSIRMGYMILPPQLKEAYERTSGGFSCTVPVLDQYVLAEFINRGHFEQHLNRVRRKRV